VGLVREKFELEPFEMPPFLGRGSLVRVIAPSGPFDEELFSAGMARLSERYQVVFESGLDARRQGFLAGSDEERLSELNLALTEPETHAIWLARGGYGLSRLLDRLKLPRGSSPPKWFVGFSDATALHQAFSAERWSSLHAANVTGLAQLGPSDWDRTTAYLEGTGSTPLDLAPQNPEARDMSAEGAVLPPVVGGNLTVLFAEAAAGRLQVPRGATLFIEDVSETSYRVDRMLTALLHGGHLDQVAALVLGDFWQCSPGKFEVPVEDVLKERLGGLSCPVFVGAGVGHAKQNAPIVLGQPLAYRLRPA
jgi:muramoyltetrapeptide carboxypeptidase